MNQRIAADWPDDGPIDLEMHDCPHASSSIEWWYVNGHFTVGNEQGWSVFAAFFRARISDQETIEYGHSLVCGLVDQSNNVVHTATYLDPRTPAEGIKAILKDVDGDPRINQSLREVFERNAVPLPDRLLEKDACIKLDGLDLDYAGSRFFKTAEGDYQLKLNCSEQQFSCDLRFSPVKRPVRHGDNGVVKGHSQESMFYYFIPRCDLAGSLSVAGEKFEVVNGLGWYDHEFGHKDEHLSAALIDNESSASWNWVAVQLSNQFDISAYEIYNASSQQNKIGRWAIVIDPEGNRQQFSDFKLTPLRSWFSARTFRDYPVEWELKIPAIDLQLIITASPENQEVVTLLAYPAFWESSATVCGTHQTHNVTGRAFIERTGFDNFESLDDYFSILGSKVRQSIGEILPNAPDAEQALELIAGDEFPDVLDKLDISHYIDEVINPLREFVQRGGKAWRSYGSLLCIDLVGGDPHHYIDVLLFPELIHSGSLIIDDIQDQSKIRRGKPTSHEIFGIDKAINIGTSAYFLAENVFSSRSRSSWDTIDSDRRLRMYELYFQAMRAGHAGQSLDLRGFSAGLAEAVRSGENTTLENSILAMQRLKSAVPAAALAKIGAVAGGGNDNQINTLGRYFEQLGLAFQIMDDVINIQGFTNDMKNRGEDVIAGKITMPVARAIGIASPDVRVELASLINQENISEQDADRIMAIIKRVGALEECKQYASNLLEKSWLELDRTFPDSHAKVTLRAYSFFVLQSHY